MPIGFCTSMWTTKNHEVVAKRVPEGADQRGSPNSVEVGQPDEDAPALPARTGTGSGREERKIMIAV
jgi:hypothetical protein